LEGKKNREENRRKRRKKLEDIRKVGQEGSEWKREIHNNRV
jgi:hypothetical protein